MDKFHATPMLRVALGTVRFKHRLNYLVVYSVEDKQYLILRNKLLLRFRNVENITMRNKPLKVTKHSTTDESNVSIAQFACENLRRLYPNLQAFVQYTACSILIVVVLIVYQVIVQLVQLCFQRSHFFTLSHIRASHM